MKVILEGEERVVTTIIRENRVRVSRGNIKFSPADSPKTPRGVSDEDVEKMGDAIESMMDTIETKDAQIEKLQAENDALKAALEEKVGDSDTQAHVATGDGEGENADSKDAPAEDSKEAPAEDAKEVLAEDAKDAPAEDTDAKGKKRSKK